MSTRSFQVTVPPDVREVVDAVSPEAAAIEAVRRVEYRRLEFPVGSGLKVVSVDVFDGAEHFAVEVRGDAVPTYEVTQVSRLPPRSR